MFMQSRPITMRSLDHEMVYIQDMHTRFLSTANLIAYNNNLYLNQFNNSGQSLFLRLDYSRVDAELI